MTTALVAPTSTTSNNGNKAPETLQRKEEPMPINGVMSQPSASIHLDTPGTPPAGKHRHRFLTTEQRRKDEALLAAIVHTLEWNRIIPLNQICAAVSYGGVVLTGTAYTVQDREDAERLVTRLPNVADVTNLVEVMNDEVLAARLKKSIVGLLARRSISSYEDLEVGMKQGRVLLTGTVGSITEKRIILEFLHWTHHRHAIEDRLIVAQHSNGFGGGGS